ncbi:MAG: hypothetical protein QOG15_645 [Solirubrobacteraceae bacterium]|jgi:glycosyltransferase involved in cell wall biosynthesis|nr:hypothetical protein [Solirubrobacteraceae bacterium]
MRPKIVVLGMMAKMPVPGVLWQTLHYLLGLEQLGFEAWYVEANARTPTMLMRRPTDDGTALACALIDRVTRAHGLGDRWAYHALHDDGRCHGMSPGALRRLYRDAEIVINLHGGSEPRPEFGDRLVYLETDPVRLQVELHDGVAESREFLAAHCAFFTFAENLGRPDCGLPTSTEFDFRPTRQPVVLEHWAPAPGVVTGAFTTIGNWHQGWRSVSYGGETYGWSKDEQWKAFVNLPARTGQAFELALSGYREEHRAWLESKGWGVRAALAFGSELEPYRDYIAGSRGEFTVAKDQNVRLRSGWFSDRSATYLAAGRPVVTQDTGFGCALPTGEGLFAVGDIDEATAAIEAIVADEPRHRRAAQAVAQEYFDATRVLGDLLAELGIGTGKERSMTGRDGATHAKTDGTAKARRRLTKESRVLALIPHYACEEWLDDALESLAQQTHPLDAIVVIDDASDEPPTRLVQRHPGVTLLHADRNVGPYRLVQQVIEDTDYDAYLFQDADDWSAPDRLEKLLAAAEQTGAELIGTQELRVFCDEPEVAPIAWPLDIPAAFAAKVTAYPLLHPTSLVSRELVMALGGFASGLRFSGDAEFLRRAQHIATVANIPDHCYFRRIRQGSLTTARATGLKSPERQRVMELLWERARRNAELVAAGERPDLEPCETAPPVGLRRLAGPPLRRPGDSAPEAPGAAPAPAPARRGGPPRPVFVIGADRSGVSALAWALGQHPQLPAVIDSAWLSALAADLPVVHERAFPDRRAAPMSAERFSRTFGRAASALVGDAFERWVDCAPEHTMNVPALARLFPEALFVHIVRDAGDAVRSLVDPPLGSAAATGGTQIPAHLRLRVSEREAVERWTNAALAGAEAERALGDKRVLRVTYDELLCSPEVLVRQVLEFVGEPYDGRCLRPLRGIRTGTPDAEPAPGASQDAHPAARAAARALSAELLGRASAEAAPRAPGSRTRLSDADVARLGEKSRIAARDVIGRLVPEGATVLIASRGDEEILRIPGRICLHFPDPAAPPVQDAADAIAQLAERQASGASHLFFPFTATWWIEQHPALREHLESEHRLIAAEPHAGVLFGLGAGAAMSVAADPPAAEPAAAAGPRVVMVTDHFPKFSETFFVSKFRGLRARGWDVHVVCNRSNADQWEYFPGLRDDADLAARLHPTKDFETTIARLEPALVHFGYGTLALGRMHAAQLAGARTVVSFRGYDVNYHGLEDAACFDEVWHGADMLHFVGNDTWRRAQRRGCPADAPHTVITDAVDVSRFAPPVREAEVTGTDERPLRIVSVGRLHWKKGHEFGLTAIRALVDAGVNARCRIIGDGPHREATLFAIHDLGLSDHVELWGAQPAATVHEQLAWADVFLHPAVSEGFCVSAIEAQAMALPVVCSDADGLSENVVDGETGFVVARRDATLLAERLAVLARDGELRLRLGNGARQRATTAFDATKQTDSFERLYRELLDAPGPAAAPSPPPADGAVATRALVALTGDLEVAEARAEQLRREIRGREVVQRVQELAATALPPGATVLVISRGDERLVALPDCRGWHFPQGAGGEYAGHHPADSHVAVEHLEDLRARGAEFLVVPSTSDWWLDYYAEFAHHLDTRYARVAERDDGYVLFSLAAKRT